MILSFLKPKAEARAIADPAAWWDGLAAGGYSTDAGVRVSEASVLANATVYACVRLIAEAVGSLPLKVYRRLPVGGRVEETAHPLFSVLHSLPNPELTAYEMRTAMQGHLLLHGNAYAEVERDERGAVRALWPLRPDRMELTRDAAMRRVYVYTLPTGERVRWVWDPRVQSESPIFHVRGLSSDGYVGLSVLRVAASVFGLAQAADSFASRFFSKGSKPAGVLKTAKVLTEETAERVRKSWETANAGLTNAHRVAVLEDGVEWQAIGINPDDAELLASRRFSVAEIARIFRVPPHLVGDASASTSWGSGLEEQNRAFVQYSLSPWLVAWEQAIARDLISAKSFGLIYARHVLEGLLRGDQAARFAAYKTGIEIGMLSPDEARELEDMAPRGDGRGGQFRDGAPAPVPAPRVPDPVAEAAEPVPDPAAESTEPAGEV